MTICCFDWDDTLFPTHFLVQLATYQRVAFLEVILSDVERSFFDSLDAHVCNLLQRCAERAMTKVMIVTNSDDGWTIATAAKFMPLVHALLISTPVTRKSVVEVISAKVPSLQITTMPCVWKYLAFEQILMTHPDITTFLSIGDSDQEKMAVGQLRRRHPHVRCVSLKTIPNPTPAALLGQTIHLTACLDSLHDPSLDWSIRTYDAKNVESREGYPVRGNGDSLSHRRRSTGRRLGTTS